MKHAVICLCLLVASLIGLTARATTNLFFNASQTMTVVSSNMTAVTINSGGYLFTYSRDGYFTGGVGMTNPVGRFFSVLWPNGVQAQAYTAGPLVGTGANITIKRTDGKRFNFNSFTGKILLNTAGAGGAFEIMPKLAGEDAFANPLMYDCSGYGGQSFSYTPSFVGYDSYTVHMWGDFALTALTLTDTNPVAPPVSITNTVVASISPVGAGSVVGVGSYLSNSICTVTATANFGWIFMDWTQNGVQVGVAPDYQFTVTSNCVLVARFTTNTPPVALGGTFYQLTNAPLAINIADLMAFDYDLNGDLIYFTGTSATTANGLVLTNDGAQIILPANSLADSFTYTINDGNGGIATGTATISTITSPASRAGALDLTVPGEVVLSASGVPWYFYEVQRATNAAFTGTLQNWPVQADASGIITIWDNFPDLTSQPEQAFYRLQHIPQ